MGNCCKKNERLGTVGGQAVMEGVMMNSEQGLAIAVRNVDGDIVVRQKQRKPLKNRCRFFKIPIIRGIVGFIDSMMMSFSTLTESTEMLGLEAEAEPETKFEKWLDKTFGDSIMTVVSVIGTVLGLVLSVVLFMWLPAKAVALFEKYVVGLGFAKAIVEGLLKIVIFVSYILLTSLMKDIRRVFMYHGAEDKTIFCYENGLELTVENVRAQSRFHPRCGTSFLFVIMIISILVGSVLTWDTMWLRMVLKLLTLPVVVGIGYEYIRYAGKHDNALTKILSAPGLWMQRITTREPDDSMIEVAIVSVKSSLTKEFEGFDVPTEEKVAELKKQAKQAEENKKQEISSDENI